MLILAILATGGALFMQRATTSVAVQKNKRVALEAACGRLEQLRAQPYNLISTGPDGQVRYASVRYSDGSFRVVPSKPDEKVSINGVQRPIYVELIHYSRTKPEREFVQAKVYVEYRLGETVSLATNLR